MPYVSYYDPTYVLIILAMVLSLLASFFMNSTFSTYSRVQSRTGMTGAMAAEQILRYSGIYDVRIEHIRGNLTDHYDPRTKTLRLSDSVFQSGSVAAIGVAAHECGHAVQHAKGYVPLKIRSALVPIANFGAKIAWPLFVVGFLIRGSMGYTVVYLGIILFSLSVLFQLVTLPVEFNASHRALVMLKECHILSQQEASMTRKVLCAAAMTYVAAAVGSLLQLMRLVLLNRRRD
ncbi:MAG: zinc metallopeptidase [Clostridiales bacterium]|nr:zinc metallopeptidase [Clostridiales bacterium]